MFKKNDEVIVIGENGLGHMKEFKGKVIDIEFGKIVVHVDNPDINDIYSPSFSVMYFNESTLIFEDNFKSMSYSPFRDTFNDVHSFRFRLKEPNQEVEGNDGMRLITVVVSGGEEYEVWTDYKTSLEELIEDGNKSLKFYNKDKTLTFTFIVSNIVTLIEVVDSK